MIEQLSGFYGGWYGGFQKVTKNTEHLGLARFFALEEVVARPRRARSGFCLLSSYAGLISVSRGDFVKGVMSQQKGDLAINEHNSIEYGQSSSFNLIH